LVRQGAVVNRIVIVGASLAGIRAAEALRREGHDGQIILLGAEPHPPYDRPPLSKQLLAGRMTREQLELRVDPGVDAELRLSTRAIGLDLAEQKVIIDSGQQVPFDALIVATGAHPRTLPGLPPLEGVVMLRTVEDGLILRQAFDTKPRIVVVGAGFIGSEVAATAHGLGLDVTVVEALPVPMVRAIGIDLGRRCGRLHLDHGVDLRLGVGVTGLVGNGRVEGVRLEDATVIPADVVVVGVGVAPTTGWLEGSGLDLADGLRCDQWCRALTAGRPVPTVVGAGDVARWDHPLFGEAVRVEHWTNAVEQGHSAATALLRGEDAPPFAPVPYFWSDQYETKIQFVGRPGPDMRVVEGSLDDDRFVVAFGREDRLVGALSFNRAARIMRYRALIAAGSGFPPEPPSG
jgi:NADPH-dependent 2,4-dienoyl-CoA reductase/sulfur reductase-like enzyme